MASTSAIRPTTIKIDNDTKTRMQRLAQSRQRSAHWMILEAIREFVEREEKREAFRQDGINAWNTYQTTGQHLTFAEADAWLATLEAGRDIEPPECHS